MNFPDSPLVGDQYTFGDRTWEWTGAAWKLVLGYQGPAGPTGPTGAGAPPEWETITTASALDLSVQLQRLDLDAAWSPAFANVPSYPENAEVTLFVEAFGTHTITWPTEAIWIGTPAAPADGFWSVVEIFAVGGRILMMEIASGDDADPFYDTPLPLSSAMGWFAYYDVANVDQTTDGGGVSVVYEPKNRLHAVQPIAGSRPTLDLAYDNHNSRPALVFDGGDFMRCMNLSLPTPHSVIAVASANSVDSIMMALGFDSASQNRGLGFGDDFTGLFRSFVSVTTNYGGQVVANECVLIESFNDGTNSRLIVNGVTVAEGLNAGTGTMNQLVLGSGYSSSAANFLTGAISLVAVYDGDYATDPDWEDARAEICTYYGISYATEPTGPGTTFPWEAFYTADSSAVSNGQAVEQFWRDETTNGNHLCQRAADLRPTLATSVAVLNNQAAFDFDGSNDYFYRKVVAGLGDVWSIIAIIVPDVVDTNARVVGTGTSSEDRGLGFSTSGSGLFQAATGGSGSLSGGTPSISTAYKVELFRDGTTTNSTLRVNDSVLATGSVGATANTFDCIFVGGGGREGLNLFNGKIAAVGIYVGGNHRDDPAWATEEAALDAKYGF